MIRRMTPSAKAACESVARSIGQGSVRGDAGRGRWAECSSGDRGTARWGSGGAERASARDDPQHEAAVAEGVDLGLAPETAHRADHRERLSVDLAGGGSRRM